LTKTGSGNLTLSGTNTFSGGNVTILAGTLLVSPMTRPWATNGKQRRGSAVVTSASPAPEHSGSSRTFNLNSFGNYFWAGNAGTIDFGGYPTPTLSGSVNGNGFHNLECGVMEPPAVLRLTNTVNNSNQGPFILNVNAGGTMTTNQSVNLSAPSYLTINVASNGTALFKRLLSTAKQSSVITVAANANATFNGDITGGTVAAVNVTSPEHRSVQRASQLPRNLGEEWHRPD